MSKITKTKNKADDKQEEEQEQREEIEMAGELAANNTPIIFSWETMDFIKKPVTEFYLTLAVFGAMAMIGWGIYNRSFIMTATFLMVIVAIILVLNEEPKKIKVKITEKGLDIDEEHFNFREFKSFKISHAEELPLLTFIPKKTLFPFRSIYIENEPADDLENFLEIFLENKGEEKE